MSLTPFQYHSINRDYESLFKDRGSKFLGLVFPCGSEAILSERLEQLRELHSKAVHHCWAIRLRDVERSTDDGEPSGTAGKPMLGQLVKNELFDVAAIVVRYYGGVNLGTGGLIKAYRAGVELALENHVPIIKEIRSDILVRYTYEHIAAIEKLIRMTDWVVKAQDFGAEPSILFSVIPDQVDQAVIKIKAMVGGFYEGEVDAETIIPSLKVELL